ncbi:hypothetical protein SAMN02799630_02749 [Paenibacillus sp. UNCCL117]|uniref:hypothetical protein n=1 Tax=unclassified Paenibacillus TaxID=185978 RepID=UPI00088A7B36|nr:MULTISPECIES: hypothetical protein [unclassified Paenibacillus]SDD30877.1 hypothetical protein SAMN04488602_107219 [Paenibacillus sp. cl123]SFW40251.1 hypothetical protein SAMN02799630_02749 [Paenibacillus sp. UNCCL117]
MNLTHICGDLYNRLFAVQISSPELRVDYEVWTRIYESLPEGYTLPDYEILQALQR